MLERANTALVLDSAADLPDPEARHPNWRLVNAYVIYGDVVLRDYVDITPAEMYRRLRASREPPRTAHASPGDFAAVFESLPGFEHVLAVTVSSEISGMFNSARLAAEETGGRVVAFDSGSVSGGVVLLADAIQRRLDRGTTLEEVRQLVARYRDEARFVYTLETLEYLARGGRIGRAAALAGSLLDTRPVLELARGTNVPLRRVRGRARSLEAVRQAFAEGTDDDAEVHVGIVHADARADAEELARWVAEVRPATAVDYIAEFGAALGAHVGPGVVGIYWFEDGT